jgi:hypothetical protein
MDEMLQGLRRWRWSGARRSPLGASALLGRHCPPPAPWPERAGVRGCGGAGWTGTSSPTQLRAVLAHMTASQRQRRRSPTGAFGREVPPQPTPIGVVAAGQSRGHAGQPARDEHAMRRPLGKTLT